MTESSTTFSPAGEEWPIFARSPAGLGGEIVLRRWPSTSGRRAVFVFPGLEGSGESCLDLVEPVLRRSGGDAFSAYLVDYSAERCATFDELAAAVHKLLLEGIEGSTVENSVIWAQSFGNLLVLAAARRGGLLVERAILVSPFTGLPPWKSTLSGLAMAVTPTALYRLVIGPLGRLVFGPAGDRPDHRFFAAMARADAPTVRRRSGWLRGRKFKDLFEGNPWASTAFLGTRDRLVDLPRQRAFFAQLEREEPASMLVDLEGSGHVALPSSVVASASRQIEQHLHP